MHYLCGHPMKEAVATGGWTRMTVYAKVSTGRQKMTPKFPLIPLVGSVRTAGRPAGRAVLKNGPKIFDGVLLIK